MNQSIFTESKTQVDSGIEEKIYECLNKGLKLSKLPENLEELYIKSGETNRHKRFVFLGSIGIIFYNLFLIGDKIMLPDIFKEALITRLFLVTPLMILSIIEMVRTKKIYIIDIMAGNLLLLTSLSIMYFLLISKNTNINNYHSGLLIIVMFGNIILRLRFKYAFFYSFLILILYSITAFNIPLMNSATVNNSILVLFTIVCFSLVGNYHFENESRMNFLNSLLRKLDAEKLSQSNKMLEQLSISDGLTGLPNRRHFDLSSENEWKACARKEKPVSLIFMDIDFFKKFNDNYGHQAGDKCLQKISGKLHLISKRPRDLAARYGGEEFVVLLPDTDSEGAVMLAEKIRTSVENLRINHNFSEVSEFVTISLGVATMTPSMNNDPSSLIKLADIALYEAKALGRNQVYLYPKIKNKTS